MPRIYALYDKEGQCLIVGTARELAKYMEVSEQSIWRLSRKESFRCGKLKGYTVERIKDDED